MLHKNLLDTLAHGGLTRDGDAFTVPSGQSVTIYLDVSNEALIVDRVVRVEVGPELAAIVTHRRERYVVELDRVSAIRFQTDSAGPGYA